MSSIKLPYPITFIPRVEREPLGEFARFDEAERVALASGTGAPMIHAFTDDGELLMIWYWYAEQEAWAIDGKFV